MITGFAGVAASYGLRDNDCVAGGRNGKRAAMMTAEKEREIIMGDVYPARSVATEEDEVEKGNLTLFPGLPV
jgi:hypothetical protein